mgnify:CR=1 FL=1
MASQYPRNIITIKGYNLLAESIATKKAVVFTKVVVGDGDDSDKNINQLTNVISPKMELPVSSGTKDGDGQYLIVATLSNSTVEQGFFPREIALFAKIDGGEEIMYSYTNGGNQVGYIPDKNTPIDSEIYKIRTKIGNAQNITFVHQDSTYVTKGELTAHNKDTNAHKDKFALYQKVATLGEDIIKKLALTTTITAVSSLQENSWFGQLLKWVLTASGVRYNLAENGYICLGSFFGGLIIQWGSVDFNGKYYTDIGYPISFSAEPFSVLITDSVGNGYEQISDFSVSWGKNGRSDTLHLQASTKTIGKVTYLAIGS